MTLPIEDVSEKFRRECFLLDVSLRMFGGVKVNQDATNELAEANGVDPSMINVSSKLFDSDRAELDAARSAHTKLARIVQSMAIGQYQPGGPRTGAQSIVRKSEFYFGEKGRAYQIAKGEAAASVDALCDALPRMIASSKAALNGLAPPDDQYPTEEQIRAAFDARLIGPHPIPAISDLDRTMIPADVADAVAEELLENRKTEIEDTIKRSFNDLHGTLVDNLRRMATTMNKVATATEGEKRARVMSSLTDNLRDTVTTMREHNMFDCAKVDQVCDAIERTLLAVHVHEVKKDKERAGKMAKIAEQIQNVVENDAIFY